MDSTVTPTPAEAVPDAPAPVVVRELREGPKTSSPDLTPRQAVAQAATDASKLDAQQAASATDWFLSDEQDEEESSLDRFEINVGGKGEGKEKWVAWTIQSVDLDELRRIQRLSTGRRGSEDEFQANVRVVVKGSVDPDFKAIAKRQGIADPTVALLRKLGRKPGLIAQIASRIMELSGFDTDDVREARAAGN